ncbi:MAG: hypothetical protein LUG51_14045 [Tannerellaceae bacterium]|nr:hypothetical protein [Tannerellaceae bacterium]
MSENEKLEVQNQSLKEKIREKEELYNQYLEKSKSEYVQENQELILKFDKLRRRKEILLEQVIRKNSLLSRLHNAPESEEQFTEKDLRELIVIVNKLYDGFANRLQMKYGELTQEEIQYCCLLKIKMKPKQIAAIFKIKPDNVYKRKQRIKEKIGLENSKLEDLLNELEFED